jgi:excinuclease UvrABC ATPase subunit
MHGLGKKRNLDPDLIVADPSLSLREGAISHHGQKETPSISADA